MNRRSNAERRMMNTKRTGVVPRRSCITFSIQHSAFSILLLILGCTDTAPTTRPDGTYERSQQALRDPFGYSPDIEKTDISGGGISEYDKDAMRKDMQNVLDP